MADHIQKLKGLIKTSRIEDSKGLLANLGNWPEEDRQSVIEMLALASDTTALDLIGFLMGMETLGKAVQDRLFQLATDRAHLNYAFTELLLTHGTAEQIRHIIPLFKHILSKATKGGLLNLILRSAGKLKLTPLTDDVAEFIFYDDDDLKRESVKALERMGTPAALKHLEHIAGTEKCDMDILDAIDMLREKLGPDSGAGPITKERDMPADTAPFPPGTSEGDGKDLSTQLGLLASDRMDQRFDGYGYFVENQHLVAEALHQNLDTENHDLLINLLRLTARTIPQKVVGDLITLAARKNMEKSLKFALLTALAAFPELESAAAVLEAADDSAMYVRLAAVKVLDRHCSDYIAAEIKNKIEAGTKRGEALGISILDAGATRLTDALMASDTFSYIASNYLERSAPVQAIDAYLTVLENRNRTSTLKKYRRIRLERAEQKLPFFVVIHPIQAYLDVYAKLIHSCGFHTRCFAAPQQAFESIMFEKPAAVICDLFVRHVTVMELAGEIRELYTPKEVPIIVSTLQRELDTTMVEKEFQVAGINGLFGFPAKAAQIKSWGAGK